MKKFNFISNSNFVDCDCDICPLVRQTKLSFPNKSIKTKRIFELILIDTLGPYKSPTYNGFQFFFTIADDFSRKTWTYLLSV